MEYANPGHPKREALLSEADPPRSWARQRPASPGVRIPDEAPKERTCSSMSSLLVIAAAPRADWRSSGRESPPFPSPSHAGLLCSPENRLFMHLERQLFLLGTTASFCFVEYANPGHPKREALLSEADLPRSRTRQRPASPGVRIPDEAPKERTCSSMSSLLVTAAAPRADWRSSGTYRSCSFMNEISSKTASL